MMPCRWMEVHKLECHDVCMVKCNIHLFAASFLTSLEQQRDVLSVGAH